MSIKYENLTDINNNNYLNKLESIAEQHNLYSRFISTGIYSFENKNGGYWFVYGLDNKKVNDPSLIFHINEIIDSRNDKSELYFDFNVIRITDSPAFAIHQEVAYKIALISFLEKCFRDRYKPLPDKMNLNDAISIARLYRDSFNSLSHKNTDKHHKSNMKLINMIIRFSDVCYNPLHPKYQRYIKKKPFFCCPDMNFFEYIYSRFFKKNKNRISSLTLIRRCHETKTLCCDCKIADLLIKELYKHPDILFFVSPKSSRVYNKDSFLFPKNNGPAKVRYFMFNKADFEKILVLYYKILYPKSFLYSLDDLKKIGLYTYCYVYTHDYSFFEFFMSNNNIPFTISPNANLYDHNAIHVWFDKKYSDEVINFLNSLANDTRLYKIEMNNVSTDEDYLFATVMQNAITLSSLVSSPAVHEWESKQKENTQNRINKQKNANLKSQW